MPTAGGARGGKGRSGGRRRQAEAGGGRRRRAEAGIKSRDPHLAGGEKPSQLDMESPCKPVVDFSCKH